jgi:hypothetical protein
MVVQYLAADVGESPHADLNVTTPFIRAERDLMQTRLDICRVRFLASIDSA